MAEPNTSHGHGPKLSVEIPTDPNQSSQALPSTTPETGTDDTYDTPDRELLASPPSTPNRREGQHIRIKGSGSPVPSAHSRNSSVRSTNTITPPRPKIEIPERPGSMETGSSMPASTTSTSAASSMIRPPHHRQTSTASLSFVRPGNPSLPQGTHKKTDKGRIKASSPPPSRFQTRIAFDNLPLGEGTQANTSSLTLNVRHQGYQAKRRSRTFMIGVDEHAYSDYALQWLLDELVDDGDEVVCVRVVERDTRSLGTYQDDAQSLMKSIIAKNDSNRAISVVLEYACGKLHSTFQKLIQIYQPSLLVVGTRGRSLGGLQGLVKTRNSFSKYCLQYSPIPVVVVRPTEKREKKKHKRQNDAERQTYAKMLSATGGKHEADSERSSMYEVEVKFSADEEASQVAKVLGLPASFDPTIKPLNAKSAGGRLLQPSPSPSPQPSAQDKRDDAAAPKSPSSAPPSAAGDSEPELDPEDDDDDDDEDEFEVMTGEQALDEDQQERLHDMEVGEAAALLKQNRRLSGDSTLPDEDEEKRHKRKVSAGSSI